MSVASTLLIYLLQGQSCRKGYDPKYLNTKSLEELKENEAGMFPIISLPPKQQ